MPCYEPLNAYMSKQKGSNGKNIILFKNADPLHYEQIALPCGQCIGCRLERSRQWAIRCVHESKMHRENCFITCTYDDEHLERKCEHYDTETGEFKGYSLNKREWVLFVKRLRKYIEPTEIRFFHCGEYGDKLARPHHHACIFGFDFPDKELWSDKGGVKLYTSEILNSVWKNGYCIIGEVNFESAAYVARYVTKKITGEKAAEYYDGLQPEYVTMSRGGRSGGGGIGFGFLDKFKDDIMSRDAITLRGGLTLRPAKYYDKKIELYHPQHMEEVKKKRKSAITMDGNTRKRLDVKKKITLLRAKQLKRNYENGTSSFCS